MAKNIGSKVILEVGFKIFWYPEGGEIYFRDAEGGAVHWECTGRSAYWVIRNFIETEWQFICLADFIAKLFGFKTSKIGGDKVTYEIEFLSKES